MSAETRRKAIAAEGATWPAIVDALTAHVLDEIRSVDPVVASTLVEEATRVLQRKLDIAVKALERITCSLGERSIASEALSKIAEVK